jgi:hypothetical protein
MSLLRPLLVWLMVLALPLQGLAAATMLNCATAHGAEGATVAAHGDSAPHDHDHDHDHGAMTGAHADAAGDAHAPDHKCSACAACHASLGLPAALPLLPDFDVAEAHRPVPAIGVSPFLTGGLERPPRSALA